jgi:hypothetical protein
MIRKLMKSGKWYSAADIGKAAGIKSDLAYAHLKRMIRDGLVIAQIDPKNPNGRQYMRTSAKPKVKQRAESRKRGEVWSETWPHADPVVMAAMRAMIREGVQA